MKIPALITAFFLLSSTARADAPPGFVCKDGTCSRQIGSNFSSPTFNSGDPFKAEVKSSGATSDCPDGTCNLRSRKPVSAPAGADVKEGCKTGTCGKSSSFAAAPPTPGAASKAGGCSTGTCGSPSKAGAAKASGASAKSGSCGSAAKAAGKAGKSCAKGGMNIVRKILSFLTFGLLG